MSGCLSLRWFPAHVSTDDGLSWITTSAVPHVADTEEWPCFDNSLTMPSCCSSPGHTVGACVSEPIVLRRSRMTR